MSIHAVLLAMSVCAVISTGASRPFAKQPADQQQARLTAFVLSLGLSVGNAACLLPDVPAWYSLTVVTLTTAGLFWVVASLLAATRRDQARATQARAAEHIAARTGAAGPGPTPAARDRQVCPGRRAHLRALPAPTDADGFSRPALGQTRPGRPRLAVVSAALTDDAGPTLGAPFTTAPPLSSLRAYPVATRAELNAATPIQTHPQAVYVARDIASYARERPGGRGRVSGPSTLRSVQARMVFAAHWRARVSAAYDDELPLPPRLGDRHA